MRLKTLSLVAGLAVHHLFSAAAAYSNGQPPSRQRADQARREWKAINVFLVDLLRVPVFHTLARDVCGIVTLAQALKGVTASVSSVRNDAGCADVTVLFARGTCEPGNVGAGNAPAFFDSLAAMLRRDGRSLGVRGFAYPASVNDFLSGTKVRGSQLSVHTSPFLAWPLLPRALSHRLNASLTGDGRVNE